MPLPGWLFNRTAPPAPAPTGQPASPRPQVVEDILAFLSARVVELEEQIEGPDEDGEGRLKRDRDATSHLLDLVLYVFHGLEPNDIERVEADRHASA